MPTTLNAARRFAIAGLLASLLSLGACAPPVASPPPAAEKPLETWEVVLIQGARVGYVHTTVANFEQQGKKLLRIQGVNHLVFQRGGQKGTQDVEFTSLETPDGQLIEFDSLSKAGPVGVQTTGKVRGAQLEIRSTTLGKTVSASQPWSPQYGGFFALEQSLRCKPMKPGEKRSLKLLLLGFNELVTAELAAVDYEPTKLLSGSYDLLRINTQVLFADGRKLPGVSWADRSGEVLKSTSPLMQMESYRVSKQEALDEQGVGRIDLLAGMAVKPDRPLPGLHSRRQMTYRVALAESDPAAVFEAGWSQAVRSLGARRAELTVYGVRPGDKLGNPLTPDDPPGSGDRQPNNTIQSDNPNVIALARKAAGQTKGAWPTALALERFVHSAIKKKDFSQAFATAAEVARSLEGDCTEHAVLLAALARVQGIPARVAMGLVYVERERAFMYHMWTEVYVDGRWIGLDGTLALGGLGAGHLKLSHSNLQGVSPYSSFLPVVQVMGQLSIAAIGVKPH